MGLFSSGGRRTTQADRKHIADGRAAAARAQREARQRAEQKRREAAEAERKAAARAAERRRRRHFDTLGGHGPTN